MADAVVAPFGWERALMAAERVKERLRRATKALADAGVPYAVVGGNAVAEWVARVDEDAVRNTRDVDILIRRADLHATRAALESAGFVYQQLLDVDMFLDGPDGRPSAGVHLLYAAEKVRPEHVTPSPDVAESERAVPGHIPGRTRANETQLESAQRSSPLAGSHRRRFGGPQLAGASARGIGAASTTTLGQPRRVSISPLTTDH